MMIILVTANNFLLMFVGYFLALYVWKYISIIPLIAGISFSLAELGKALSRQTSMLQRSLLLRKKISGPLFPHGTKWALAGHEGSPLLS